MNQVCKNCKYWKKFGQTQFDRKTKDAGRCRKHPRRAFYTSSSANKMRDVVNYRFPISADDDLCGEFEPCPEQ